jgi:hypothetical protein
MPARTGDESIDAARREVAARVRAAMGYAGLTAEQLVSRCELVTVANLRRTVGAKRDTPALELVQIADACGVPWSWFSTGEWHASSTVENSDAAAVAESATNYLRFGEGTSDERLLMLETYMAIVLRALAVLGNDAVQLPLDGVSR